MRTAFEHLYYHGVTSRQVSLPVKTGWVPSWEPQDEVTDQVWDDIVEALVREVSDIPTDPSPDSVEGFASWRDSLSAVSDHDLIAEVALTERTIRQASARQLALVGEFASRQPGTRWIGGRARGAGGEFVADHVALAMGTSMRSAERRIHEAENLAYRFPKLHAALACGLVGLPGVRTFLLETAGVSDPATAAEVEARVIDGLGHPWVSGLGRLSPSDLAELPFADIAPLAGAATPGELTRRTRAAVTRLAKDALRAKNDTTHCTKVELVPGLGTGMSFIGAHLPDDQALTVYEHIDQLAQERRNGGEDPDGPGIDALRAAVFVDLLLTSCQTGQPAPSPVNIHVLIDANGDATTPRLGPITPTTLDGLTSLAERTGGVVTTVRQTPVTCPGQHEADGADDPHDPNPATKRTIALRNQVCVFPGCVRPTQACDLDHTVPWPHGPTCLCNLGPLCRHHHRLKTHDPGWSLTNHGNGTYTWTTPHGTRHTATP